MRESLPPYSPEAERGVLGCCLIDLNKTTTALKAGVSSRWFYENRHAEIFTVLASMVLNGGGDALVATLLLREKGKLDSIGGPAYLSELQNSVPSAENLTYYLPELEDRFRRRQVLDAATRLKLLAQDFAADSAAVLTDTENLLETLHRQADSRALPEIISAKDLIASEIPIPGEVVANVLHQGSKLILGGASKSYKTWALTDLAVSVSTGSPWLGFATNPGKVLYVNLEIQAGFFRRRIADVIDARKVELNENLQIWNLRGWLPDYRALIPKIEARIRNEQHTLVILDPTYKLLGAADENSATDITALLNTIEGLAVSTGAAVAMAGHFAKGNASAKETIDRISGSGVFARDPDSLVIFTRHEEEGAFVVEMVLRNFPPLEPFVVQWQWPVFRRADSLDPSRLRTGVGRPVKYTPDTLLEGLGNHRLTSGQWKRICSEEFGVSHGRFFSLLKALLEEKKVQKSVIDGKWEQIREQSNNSNRENHQ